jgi:quercetin dioxygenase-like cupin family protein
VSYQRKTIDELTSRFGGVVKLARKDLGITAFGCQVFQLPPNGEARRHNEAASGQQELYVNLAGDGWIEIDGQHVEFGPGTLIHVASESMRLPRAGANGLTYLCVGAPAHIGYQPNSKFE